MKVIEMKKGLLSWSFALLSLFTHAQGLEKIIVEKYYISNEKDSSAKGGHLPESPFEKIVKESSIQHEGRCNFVLIIYELLPGGEIYQLSVSSS